MTTKILFSLTMLLFLSNNTNAQTIPEAAREKYIIGITLRDQAKTTSDYDLPISKFKDAISLAPTWADAYKELGLTLELAGQFDEAIENLTKYLSMNPPSDNARKAQDEIYIIKGKKEKAIIQKEANSPKAIEASLLKNVEGAKFVYHEGNTGEPTFDRIYEIKERTLFITLKIYYLRADYHQSVDGHDQIGEYQQEKIPYEDGVFIITKSLASTQTGKYVVSKVIFTITISSDGKTLIIKRNDGGGTITVPRQ